MIEALAAPAHATFLPRYIRGLYAVALKRSWQWIWPRPIVRSIPGVGLMRLRPNSIVSYRLGVFGIWEPAISHFMRSRISNGAVCIDVGANIGYFSLLMSRASPDGRVYAIEPSPVIRSELDENIALNGMRNIVVVPFGISDRTEKLAFHVESGDRGSSRFTSDGEHELELRTLTDVVPAEHLARAEILKIDVEGMEDRVLAHVLSIIEQFPGRLTICAEIRLDDNLRTLLRGFTDRGFKVVILQNEYSSFFYAKNAVSPPQPLGVLTDGMYDLAIFRDA
jgi:FkbM family methyltransferase